MLHDANFCIFALLLAPAACFISRIPMRVFPRILRQLMQLGFVFGATYWLKSRVLQFPFSYLLIEMIALMLPALYLTRKREEHHLLLLGLICFIGYGCLTPNRAIFFPTFVILLFCFAFLLYSSRTSILGLFLKNSRQIFVLNYMNSMNVGYCFLHLIGTLLLAAFFVSQFSMTRKIQTTGLIPSGFKTEQKLRFPKFWNEWIAPTKKMLSGKGGKKIQSDSAGKNIVLDNKSSLMVSIPGKKGVSSKDSGSSGIGDELLFKVISPVKLYWGVQTYDTYNGKKWTRSEMMLSNKSFLDTFVPKQYYEIEQAFSVLHPQSNKLPYGFKAIMFAWEESSDQKTSSDSFYGIIRREDSFVYEIINKELPTLPWHYRVVSRIPNPNLVETDTPSASKKRVYGWNYRQLPRGIISDRMRTLVKSLTGQIHSKLEKATALQNYLKKNYHYTLSPPKIPEEAEVCDYFLFESREGYCQHFAQVLTIMARLAGLPSRLVLGYSPGNYNYFSDCYDVYEYHAHAWTQIFIEPFGWLTFDGTPPGALPTSAKTKILRKIMDPFKDDFNAKPPEISFAPPSKLIDPEQKLLHIGLEKETSEPLKKVEAKVDDVINEIYSQATKKSKNLHPGLRGLLQTASHVVWGYGKNFLKKMMAGVQRWTARWKKILAEKRILFINWVQSLTLLHYTVIAGLLFAILSLWKNNKKIQRQCKKYYRRWQCYQRWRNVLHKKIKDALLVDQCQKLIFDWMEFNGIRRLAYYDIFEYGNQLKLKAPELYDDFYIVAQNVTNVWYGTEKLDQGQIKNVFQATCRFREKIWEYGQHSG
ncbi:MAG: transglutaminase domain-containing protein [Lentisphaeria bacterium]